MHPAFVARWTAARHGCRPSVGGGFESGWEASGWHGSGPGGGGGPFGVRRPLRFLAWKLDLDEQQVAELATILDDLKTERAQAEVDDRRVLKAFAEAITGEAFDADGVAAASRQRVASTERLQQTVSDALGRLHALLEPEQRARLATLIRSGSLVL